jgi:hypothetical protein
MLGRLAVYAVLLGIIMKVIELAILMHGGR